MKFTDLFIRKPVIAIVVNVALLVVGVISYMRLNVRQYPKSDSAVVVVNTVYFGASADTVRGFITTQLERVIATADGIDYIESQSAASLSSINVYLRLNYDTNAALAQISSKIDQVRNELPPEAESPTISVQSADNQFASMYLSFYTDTLEANQITDYLNRVVQPQLAAIKGVQRAEVLGGRVFAMRVWLKPDEMAARGMSPVEVRRALASNNALAAVGATKGTMMQVALKANTDLRNVEDFRNMVVAQKNGVVVRLSDVADVDLGAESYDEEVRFGGQRATFMGVWVLPNESTVEVIKRVRAVIPEIGERLPSGLKVRIGYDATKYIDDALHEIVKTLLETLAIVMVVIFLFMGSFRSVMIPIVAMPLSLLGALFIMLTMGFTVNLLTLLAIVLAVGLVVDDAIVVVENVERHVREGRRPIDAALLGARELVGPVISMTITLAAVYAPIGFQGGLTGALFREFAFTLAGAVAVSGFVALTLSPMMSAYILKGADEEEKGFTGHINHQFDRLRNAYERLIGRCLSPSTAADTPFKIFIWVIPVAIGATLILAPLGWFLWGQDSLQSLAKGVAMIVVLAAIVVALVNWISKGRFAYLGYIIATAILLSLLSVPFALMAQKELAPKEDQGVVFSIMIPSPTSTIDQNVMYAEQIQKLFEAQPEYDTSFQLTSSGFGFGGMILKPWSERTRNTMEVEQRMLGGASQITGVNAVLNTPDPLPSGGQFPIEFVIRSTSSHKEMLEYAQKLALYANTEANAGGGAPTFFFADTDLKYDLPQVELNVDRDKVAAMGLSLSDVAQDLGSMLGGGYVNRFVADGRSYRVIPQVERVQRLNAEQILNYHIRGPQGQLVPVSTFATLEETVEPRVLNRFQQLNSVKITGVGPSIDNALRKLEAKAKEILPPDYTIDYGGQSRQLRNEGNTLWLTFALALVLIFLVLAAQFNSFRDPFIILLGSVPLAIFGALLPVFLAKSTLNIYSQIGLITLVGLVAKNGILIVEFANKLQEEGVAKVDAIRRASATRLRPVLMTSAATVFGHLMLIFVTGPGAAARNSIGWVLVVGMAVGTLFTLFVVPAFYQLIATDHTHERTRLAPDAAS
ncbi:efflux RND transporter permease subunit [Nibricoccus sp. IMCC34717]|uniref:efflux RND transporter permease subunit n=1 Tax=Nibricoccus sp. IMCC34717 TaxID=3034021 RepID=UPI00384C07AB